MITTPWAHLPNAKHIDAVLADLKARPEVWAAALDAARAAARDAARAAARAAARDAVWAAARDAVWPAALGAVWDVIRALICTNLHVWLSRTTAHGNSSTA